MSATRFIPGQRVTATLYGQQRTGTVIEQRSAGIVWVVWDGRPGKLAGKPTWCHAESLTLVK